MKYKKKVYLTLTEQKTFRLIKLRKSSVEHFYSSGDGTHISTRSRKQFNVNETPVTIYNNLQEA